MINALVFGDDWSSGTTAGVSKFLQEQGVAVHTIRPFELDESLPSLDVCICTGVNVCGQGPDTDRLLDEHIVRRGIPLVMIDTQPNLESGVGPKAALVLEHWAVVQEMKDAAGATPQAFQEILDFVRSLPKSNG